MPLVPIDSGTHLEHLSYVQRAVVTTTLFTTPPSQVPDPSGTINPHASVPVGAIAGGVVAGAVLAVLATIGWLWWGKTIRRQQAKQRKEAEALKKTKRNTLRNAHISRPRIHSYRPLFPRPAEKKIKFADSAEPETKEKNDENERLVAPSVSFMREPKSKSPAEQATPIFPRKAAVFKPSATLASSTPPERTHPLATKKLPHKPSNTDSASVYSTASGEEHQIRAPPNLIIAALENLAGNSEVAHTRNSGNLAERRSNSSIWSLFSRGNSRVSQGSYDSANRYSEEPSGPVGIAL
ncbi:hypothetical protein BDQ17DRAFT_567666 [Cyathus striatus]|nr:hypothetical protein BDQ17DRAFT_567666 [Cyathus striatus]